jgi:Domain of unknown function (DUF4294)
MKRLLIVFMCIASFAQAQTTTKPQRCYATVIDGDTIPLVYIRRAVWCVDDRTFKNFIQKMRYNRLVHNIKIALPYAKIAGKKMKEYNTLLVKVKSEDEKHRVMKKVEDEMRKEFEKDLKNLTVTQGRLLLKLIDRETGNSSYTLVKELRGKSSAVFWQTLALVFGNDLKAKYEPDGDDKQVEEIVRLVERGSI